MKTLYVSDLDGTLFNQDKLLTSFTTKAINKCIEKGMEFSIATARMPYGCDYRLSCLALKTPSILSNGVFVYDFLHKKYHSVESINPTAFEQIIEIIHSAGLHCFVYTYKNDTISLYYDDQSLEEQTQYFSKRALESCAEVVMIPNHNMFFDRSNVVYLALTGTDEKLKPLSHSLQSISGIDFAYYLNIYNNLYCLEIFSDKANKKNALLKLKEMETIDRIVVFGDNLNDLSMIEIADRSYAPNNALNVVKERVTGILEDNNHDGVAKFLLKEFNL